MVVTAHLPGGSVGKSSTAPRPISRGRGRQEHGRSDSGQGSWPSGSPLTSFVDGSFGRSPHGRHLRGETPKGDTRRRSFTNVASSTPACTSGFAPLPKPRDVLSENTIHGSSPATGLLRQQLQQHETPPSAVEDGQVMLRERLRHALSNENITTFVGSPSWQAAREQARVAGDPTLFHPHVQRAYTIAATAHAGAMRRSGMPVLEHLEQTALILARLGLDAPCVAAALLHDCLDDTPMTEALLAEYVPPEVTQLVAAVSKASSASQLYRTHAALRDEVTTEKLRVMLVALGDVRVVLIKLADRLHNMRTLGALPPDARARMALETQAVFVPIANRLGVWGIKAELEDLCFQAQDPEGFRELKAEVASLLKAQETTIGSFMADVLPVMVQHGVQVEDISGRPKNVASIHCKRRPDASGRPSLALENIHDVLAVRIIVRTKRECYLAHRAITERWPEVAHRHKNYIREPKANGYQSLHTVVLADSGAPVEVQIRTPQMHWNAEFGVASHWQYKERSSGRSKARDDSDLSLDRTNMQLVQWTRMVVAYGLQLDDHKLRPRGSPARDSLLSSVADHVMTAASSRATPRRHSISGELGSFHRFVTSSMTPPPAAAPVYVITATPHAACIEALPPARATVGALLATAAFPAGTEASTLCINGTPALSLQQPLAMGDVVELTDGPAPQRADLWPQRFAMPAASASFRRPLYGLLLHALRDETRTAQEMSPATAVTAS